MKLIQKNKKAFFDYEVLDTYIAGLVLTGPEIKSIRAGHVNLKGAYVSMQSGEPVIKGMNVSRYAYDSSEGYDAFRDRKLLLKAVQLQKIENSLKTKGISVVALAIGLVGRYAKLEIGIARGKKQHDKRNTIKDRESKRQTDRAMKNYC